MDKNYHFIGFVCSRQFARNHHIITTTTTTDALGITNVFKNE